MFSQISFFKSLESLTKDLPQGRHVLLVAQKSKFVLEALPKDSDIVGAIFPRIIYANQSYEEGYILATMKKNTSALIIKDMSHPLSTCDLSQSNSFMIILDGLSSKISNFLEKFFETVKEDAKIIGVGAGKLTLKQEPIIFTNTAMYQDSALIIRSNALMGIGAKHGWEEIEGPFIATKTNKCILEKINYMNAFELYKRVVEKDSGRVFDAHNFFDIAKGYPFGISRHWNEVVVREPITTDGKTITLVGEMDNNSVISILKGSKENLIMAAKQAATASLANTNSAHVSQSLLIDCISRYLFLENDFEKELQAIQSEFDTDVTLWGVLGLGEIANATQENIEFYNQTCVVGAL